MITSWPEMKGAVARLPSQVPPSIVHAASILTVSTVSGQQGFRPPSWLRERSVVWEACHLAAPRGLLTKQLLVTELKSTNNFILLLRIIKSFSRNHQFVFICKGNTQRSVLGGAECCLPSDLAVTTGHSITELPGTPMRKHVCLNQYLCAHWASPGITKGTTEMAGP